MTQQETTDANTTQAGNGAGQPGQPQEPAPAATPVSQTFNFFFGAAAPDTDGKKDGQAPQPSTPADADGKKDEPPQASTPAETGGKKNEPAPNPSTPADADGKKPDPPQASTPAETGGKKDGQAPQPSTPAEASSPKTEPKPPASPAKPPEAAPHSRRKIVLIAVAVVALAAVAYLVWRVFFATPKLPDSIVTLSGRIEGDDSAIAAKTTGRILEIRFREGDAVDSGDVIATLSDEQVRAREEQAQAGVSIMEAKSRSALDQIAVSEQQLQENQLQTAQAKIDAAGRVRQAEAEVAAAEADLAQQQASFQIAAFDRDAYTKLAQTGAASERQAKQAVATAGQQAAAVAAANRRVEAARGALTTAQANLENPDIHEAQAAMVRKQIVQQRSEAAGARATTEQARGQLIEAQANRQDLVVRAPFSGVIVTRAAEPGEVVVAGTALVTMVDLSKVYLRGFVPEGQIGKVKLGQPVHVYLDSNTKQPIEAWVSRIDPQAMFTPENTYFQDERVKEVVGVKLQLKGAVGFAKPGMPADGEILTQGNTWPEASRRK